MLAFFNFGVITLSTKKPLFQKASEQTANNSQSRKQKSELKLFHSNKTKYRGKSRPDLSKYYIVHPIGFSKLLSFLKKKISIADLTNISLQKYKIF